MTFLVKSLKITRITGAADHMSKTITGTITTGITLAVNPTIIDGTIQSYNDAIYSKCRMGERSATHRFFDPAIISRRVGCSSALHRSHLHPSGQKAATPICQRKDEYSSGNNP